MILVLTESEPSEPSLQALGLAATLGEPKLIGWAPDAIPAAIGAAAARRVGEVVPEVVVAAGTERGNEVMAHLAAILDLPLATNVTEVRPGDVWEVVRIRWGGSLLEKAHLTAPIKLLTIAPHTRPSSEPPAVVEPLVTEEQDSAGLVRTVEPVVSAGVSLASSKVVVSGGRGVGSAEGFAALEELAGLLGGAVGCSRVVTNNGWRPHSDQVGQTGTRVAPALYIACGISGAIQHWVGMMAAKKVLAINLDADAPMVTKADYAVIGDLHQVLPAVIDEIKRRRTANLRS